MTEDSGTISNPPDCEQLSFRVGTLATFLEDMLRQLPVQEIPDGRWKGTRPLAGVDRQPRRNWVFGLLEAWATVGDVITFYQERIANEGFLRTAVEELSVHELIRLVGYPPRPGVASATYLAFTTSGAKEMPAVVDVPKGAIVQSVPAAGKLPQTWETADVLRARAQWNQLRPAIARRSVRPPILGGATDLLLAGARTRLKPGAALLLTGTLAGVGPLRLLRIADKVKVETGASGPGAISTRVSWKGPIDEGHPDAELETPKAFVLSQQAWLFGYNAVPWNKLTPVQKRQQQPILGGVMLSEDGGGSWEQHNQGLPANPVNVLLPAAGPGLLAGTRKGLFRLGSEGWQALQGGLGSADVRSLASGDDGHVFAGTSDGRLLRSTDDGGTWEPLTPSSPSLAARLLRILVTPVRKSLKHHFPPRLTRLPKTSIGSLLVVPSRGSSRILAGTDKGVFAIGAQGDGWLALNQGFPGTDPKTGVASLPIHALAEAGTLFAGTDKGVFQASTPGCGWQAANEGLPGVDTATGLTKTKVLSLLSFTERRSRQRHLFAGTDRGIFRRAADRGRFEPVNVGLPGADPRARTAAVKASALAVSTDPTTLSTELFAGTDQGLFRSRDLGGSWIAVGTGAEPGEPVGALAADNARLAMALPFDGFAEEQWPGYFIQDGRIDLAAVVRGVVAGSWVALSQSDSRSSQELILRILDVATVRRTAYGLSALVTRLLVRPDPRLRDFDLRQTVARIQSEPLELFTREVPVLASVDPQSFTLDAQPPSSSGQPTLDRPLPVQRPLIVTGQPIRVSFAAAAFPLTLRTGEDGKQKLQLAAGDDFQVMAPPLAVGTDLELAVRGAAGVEGSVRVAATQVRWRPAEDGDETVGQVAFVAGFEPAAAGEPGPRLTVIPSLVAAFDPQTVVIYANVALVTQGETGTQNLGSGDASKAHQSFALAKPPLTYLPAANAAGMRSSLELRVGGAVWQEASSFVGTSPRDRIYVVRRDLQGNPVVTFGDGTHGARLPTGANNIVATYRSGFWEASVPANHLSLPRTRPLGLKSVNNPLPATGGTPPEMLWETRLRAPHSLRCLGRIVSRSDYFDFVCAFPGISRALLAELVTDHGPALQITVAGIGGRSVAPASNTYQQLIAAIDAVRMPGRQLRVDSYRKVLFNLEARLRTDPIEPPAAVERRVRATLVERFSFHHSHFSEIITTSEVITLILGVRGMVDVDIKAFYRSGSEATRHHSLRAHEARFSRSRRTVVPAELLLIDETDGIQLKVATS